MIKQCWINKFFIREQITPKGDGNKYNVAVKTVIFLIREQITPKGDGNFWKFLSFWYLVISLIE